MDEVQQSRVVELEKLGILEINDGYRAKNDELGATGLPFARAGNINDGFHFEEADCLRGDRIERVGRKISAPGDVVFTSKGTVGRFARVGIETTPFVYSPQLCFWRSLCPEKLDADYLYYWMSSEAFLRQVAACKGQTDMAEYVSLRDQREFAVDIPEIHRQKAIAAVLRPLDDKIQMNRRMARTLEEIACARFGNWFESLPETARLMASDLEQAGVLQINDGYRAKNEELSETGLPFVRAANLKDGINLDECDRLGEQSIPKVGNKLSRVGDVAFTSKGTVGRFARVGEHLHPFVYSPQICFWRSLDPEAIHPATLYCWMQGADFQRQVYAASEQTDMAPYVSLADQRRMKVPAFGEGQSRFGEEVQPFLTRQSLLTQENRTLAALRDTLLPKLISGELRIPDAEALVEAA